MRNLQKVILILIFIFGMSITSSYPETKKYGQEISNRTTTAIKDILANPKAYEGKLVTIEGKIDNECGSGCWFYVKVAQGNVVIYVDIGKSGFAIPQKVGKKIFVEGKVVIKESGPMIQGRGVEFQ